MNENHDIKDISLADIDQHIIRDEAGGNGPQYFLQLRQWSKKPAGWVDSLPETALPFYADYRLQSGHFS